MESVRVPKVLTIYQENMYGVDKGDQKRMHLGGFARKAHFKKWYKKSFFAILDCMLLNALTAWNLSAQKPSLKRKSFERYDFYDWIADDFLNFTGNQTFWPTDSIEVNDQQRSQNCTCVPTKGRRQRCAVCQLDSSFSSITTGTRQRVVYCASCAIVIHDHIPEPTRPIHSFFPGLTCHDIIKSPTGRQIFSRKEGQQRQAYTLQ